VPVATRSQNGILIAVLSKPERLNALGSREWRELGEVLKRECRGGGGSNAIVVTGEGRAFSAGDDIYEMISLESPEDAASFFYLLRSALRELVSCSKPVVAAVNGLAVGGGAEMLLLMDYVVASRQAWLSFPETRIGLIPPLLLTVGSEILGSRVARSLALSHRRLSADEAYTLGIVDEVVDGDPLPRAIEVAAYMASQPRHSIEAVKSETLPAFERAMKLLAELESMVLKPEAKRRMRMFLDKKLR